MDALETYKAFTNLKSQGDIESLLDICWDYLSLDDREEIISKCTDNLGIEVNDLIK